MKIPVVRVCVKTKEVKHYDNIFDARLEGFKVFNINRACKLEQWTYNNFYWFYKHEYVENKIIEIERSIGKRLAKVVYNKICTKCKVDKSIDCFGRSKRGTAGRHSHCKECRIKYVSYRRATDFKFRLSKNLRKRLNAALKAKSWNKRNTLHTYLGCTLDELKDHLTKQFTDNMSWDNYGLFGWHIDHIIPLSSANNEEELYKLCHYTNLQPLWREDNLKKSDGIEFI